MTVLPGGIREQHALEDQSQHHDNPSAANSSQQQSSTITPSKKNSQISTQQSKISAHTVSTKASFPPSFGDSIVGKEDGVCRIVSQNVGCLGVIATNNNKIRTAKEWLLQHHVDVCEWQEIGIANHVLQRHDKLHERMRDSRRKAMRISVGTNKHEDIERFQWGGHSNHDF